MTFKNKTLNTILRFAVFVVFLILTFVLSAIDVLAHGPDTTEIYGAAWSENIGWISFNSCETEGLNCGPVPYSVSVHDDDGHIIGAAWSGNIGWLKFGGDLSDFPTGNGTEAENAKINFSEGLPPTGEVKGWARFCAGTLSGDCLTMDDSPDGWDGWVSLSGDLHPAPDMSGNGGVTYNENTNKIVGKAWGGDVVGWIDFFDVSFGPPQIFDYQLTNPTEPPGIPVKVVQGGNGQVAVTRTLLSGDSEDVLLIVGILPTGVTVSVDSFQPCAPTCSSTLTISADATVSLKEYSFEVQGDVLIEGEIRTTTVRFDVVGPDPTLTVSCRSLNGPFFIPNSLTVTWDAQVINPVGDEEFLWEGDDGLVCEEDPEDCQTVDYTYATVGRKEARVSIDGGLNFAECQATIGVIMTFREI